MKKILLICDMGMSTSLVVKRMQEAAQAEGILLLTCSSNQL